MLDWWHDEVLMDFPLADAVTTVLQMATYEYLLANSLLASSNLSSPCRYNNIKWNHKINLLPFLKLGSYVVALEKHRNQLSFSHVVWRKFNSSIFVDTGQFYCINYVELRTLIPVSLSEIPVTINCELACLMFNEVNYYFGNLPEIS